VPDVFIPPPILDDWLRFSGRSSLPPQPAQRLIANAPMAASDIHRFRIFSSSFRFSSPAEAAGDDCCRSLLGQNHPFHHHKVCIVLSSFSTAMLAYSVPVNRQNNTPRHSVGECLSMAPLPEQSAERRPVFQQVGKRIRIEHA